MISSKSREHRIRVLENQQRLAAGRAESCQAAAAQLKMPLLVEVKCNDAAKQPARRARRKARNNQPDLGEL